MYVRVCVCMSVCEQQSKKENKSMNQIAEKLGFVYLYFCSAVR